MLFRSLRIRDAANPLDSSAVHPERYELLEKMAGDVGCSVADLLTDAQKRNRIDLKKYVSEEVGLPTLNDIVKELAKPGRDPRAQFEAAWALTNIASGTSEHTKCVMEQGAVPVFVQLLSSPSDDVREQAVWALGNIAGDSPRCRDEVLSQGALQPVLAQLNANAKLTLLRNATWTLSNFCRGKPPPDFNAVKPALPALAQRQVPWFEDSGGSARNRPMRTKRQREYSNGSSCVHSPSASATQRRLPRREQSRRLDCNTPGSLPTPRCATRSTKSSGAAPTFALAERSSSKLAYPLRPTTCNPLRYSDKPSRRMSGFETFAGRPTGVSMMV